jgi:hypothetical protein
LIISGTAGGQDLAASVAGGQDLAASVAGGQYLAASQEMYRDIMHGATLRRPSGRHSREAEAKRKDVLLKLEKMQL